MGNRTQPGSRKRETMSQRTNKRFLPLLMVALCGTVYAQAADTITIRILDSKTAKPLEPSGYLVNGNHTSTIQIEWVKVNEDGTGALNVPAGVSVVSIHGSYDQATEVYVNCDGEEQKDKIGKIWYSVSDILTKGVVTGNGCAKPKDLAKIKPPDPKPGEIVFFVRKKSGKSKLD